MEALRWPPSARPAVRCCGGSPEYFGGELFDDEDDGDASSSDSTTVAPRSHRMIWRRTTPRMR